MNLLPTLEYVTATSSTTLVRKIIAQTQISQEIGQNTSTKLCRKTWQVNYWNLTTTTALNWVFSSAYVNNINNWRMILVVYINVNKKLYRRRVTTIGKSCARLLKQCNTCILPSLTASIFSFCRYISFFILSLLVLFPT